MKNYEYIVAGLPVFALDYRGELDADGIVEEIRSLLDKRDLAVADLFLEGFREESLCADFYLRAAQSPSRFVRDYFSADLTIRNCKVRYLNRELGRPVEQDTIDAVPEVEELQEKAREALQGSDILGRESSLDSLYWNLSESLVEMQVFTLDAILAFISKMKIVDRWLKLDPDTGRELFARLVEEIRNNKKPIQ